VSCVAIDIGGTKIAAARVNDDGTLIGGVVRVTTPAAHGPLAVIDEVARLIAGVRDESDDRVAVSAAGAVDVSTGRISFATSSIPGWAGTDLRSELQRRGQLPVTVIGDGHAFGLGEALFGVGRDLPVVLMLAIGTGIGGSLVIDGRPQFGRRGVSGHFGHMPVPEAAGVACPCGSSGHTEAVGGGTGILHTYRRLGGSPEVSATAELADRVDDEQARLALCLGGSAVGTLAAGLAAALDPDIVVLAGSIARPQGVWWDALLTAYRDSCHPAVADTPIRLSGQGSTMALRGAAHYALQGELA